MARDRDAVLLLHGQPGSSRDWEGVISALDQAKRVVAVDRPGWGGGDSPTDLHGNAAAVIATLDARAINRATVVGHSLGAAVAAWFAVTHPDRVRALVLVAPAANAAALYPLDRWLAAPVAGYLASVAALASLGLALSTGPARRRIARGMALEDPYLRAVGHRLLAPAAWHAFAFEQRALIRDLPALERGLGTISAPTTIVAGSTDRVVPVRAARQLAVQIQGAELVLLKGAGHLLHLQQPDRLAEVIASAHYA